MLDPNAEPDLNQPTEETPPEEKSNRTFIIVVGILGGLVLLTIIGVVLYAFLIRPRLSADTASVRATAEAYNLEIAQAMTATMQAAQWTATAPATPVPLPTDLPTDTPVVMLPTEEPTGIYDPLTATMEALYTQAAIAQLTPTSTLIAVGALPEGGFAEEYGITGLLIMAVALIIVIFLARRLRVTPQKQK